MLYFEDALWIRENFWKDTIGTLYFVFGTLEAFCIYRFTGIAFHIILISILPEIANFISRPTTMILSAQFIACIVQLFVVFVPVPAMIAVNRPYFVNPVMINVPAFILVSSQCFAFIFMMVNGVHRCMKGISPKSSKLIFLDNVVYTVMIVSFGISVFFSVNICVHTTIRRFNPSQLNWKLQYFEVISYIYLISLVIIPTIISHILSLVNLSYRKLFKNTHSSEENLEEEQNESSKETICSVSFYAVFDLLYCFWICLCFLSSAPILSLSNVFLTAYWPLLTSLTLDIHIRSALIYRIRGVFQPQSANNPIVIQANKNHAKFSKF